MSNTTTSLPLLPSARSRELLGRDLSSSSSIVKESGSAEDEVSSRQDQAVPANKVPSQEGTVNPRSSQQHLITDEERLEQRESELNALRAKEKSAFGGMKPLEASQGCEVVHQYIAATSAFQNSFVADTCRSLGDIEKKIDVLEHQMALMESRLYVSNVLEDVEGNGESVDDP